MSTVPDPTRTEAFAERALGIVNGGSLSLMLSIGHRTKRLVVEVFRKGGGVDYSAFERFHTLMAEGSRTTLEATLLTRT